MSKSFYKNLLRFWSPKHKDGNWYNKLFRHICKNVINKAKDMDLSDVTSPNQKEVVDKYDIQDYRVFGKPNKDKIRSYKQLNESL